MKTRTAIWLIAVTWPLCPLGAWAQAGGGPLTTPGQRGAVPRSAQALGSPASAAQPQARPGPDSDHDGIDDETENALLARFRPYYLFSMQKGGGGGRPEHYNPADPIWYIRVSELLKSGDEDSKTIIPQSTLNQNPHALLNSETDLTRNPTKSKFHINPLHKIGHDSSDPGRHGQPWDAVLARKNVGLYGHVVPEPIPREPPSLSGMLKPVGQALARIWTETLGPYAGKTLYKIEYWQFFGYNNADHAMDFGDHEGDWATVQLLYDPEKRQVVRVAHHAHGNAMTFFVQKATGKIRVNTAWGQYEELRGTNFGRTFDDAGGTASQNTLRMLMDPQTREFTHPIVYVEYGSHEFWPTETGKYCVEVALGFKGCAPPHGGNDVAHRYLTSSVHNLGEVEAPSSVEGADIILRFNGSWGAYSRKNSPPPGPTLHTEWTWPPGSALRSRIPVDKFED